MTLTTFRADATSDVWFISGLDLGLLKRNQRLAQIISAKSSVGLVSLVVRYYSNFFASSLSSCFQARSSAARTLLDVARQQTADTRGVAAEAASAAAQAAVKSTMARFHEQQEQLLREREARLKSYRDKSRDERSRDSYSSYSASERTVDSYSRTRTSRSGTDALDRASQAKGSPGSRTYVSDDLDISRGSGQDRTTR